VQIELEDLNLAKWLLQM